MRMTKHAIAIKNEIEAKGYYRLTALASTQEHNACVKMAKSGLIIADKKGVINGTYIDYYKNWI